LKIMTNNLCACLFVATAVLVLAATHGAAQALYLAQGAYGSAYQPEPYYPYDVGQPQANSYIVIPQGAPRAYPYVRPDSAPKVLKRVTGRTDPVLVQELRRRAEKNPVINKRIVVRERPVVVKHRRIVDHPPVVVQREIVADENHIRSDRPRGLIGSRHDERASAEPVASVAPLLRAGKSQRVIRAEAEVTILGLDRMSIRLFRKRGEPAPEPAED
jgi:hypothetical protein